MAKLGPLQRFYVAKAKKALTMTPEKLLRKYGCGERDFSEIILRFGSDLEGADLTRANLIGAMNLDNTRHLGQALLHQTRITALQRARLDIARKDVVLYRVD